MITHFDKQDQEKKVLLDLLTDVTPTFQNIYNFFATTYTFSL